MRTLKTGEAASLLHVSPNTLRTWERKFGFPRPLRSQGGHRVYAYSEISVLCDALARGLSVESAVSAVGEGLGVDYEALVDALKSFDPPGADRAMESSLAIRSVERSLDEVLLPALDELERACGLGSVVWSLAYRWSIDWLDRAERLLSPEGASTRLLIGDATAGDRGSAGPRIRVLELLCRRAGVAVLTVPVEAITGLADAVAAMRPCCALLAGGASSDDRVARWIAIVRETIGAVPTMAYLRPLRAGSAQPPMLALPAPVLDAQHELVRFVHAVTRAEPATNAPKTHQFAQSS